MNNPLAGIPTDKETVKALDKAHVFHSWSAQGLIDPLPIASAEGSYFTDYDGNRYLDFSSQLVNVNIGYQHPRLDRRDPGVRRADDDDPAVVRQRRAQRGGAADLRARAR